MIGALTPSLSSEQEDMLLETEAEDGAGLFEPAAIIAGPSSSMQPSECNIIHCAQLNVQHSRAGTANLCKGIADLDTAIAFVQEPWIIKKKS